MLIKRQEFVTYKNMRGEKSIVNLSDDGEFYRQTIYFFPGRNNNKITVLCVNHNDEGDKYDEVFDKIMKTFEWIE